MFALPTASARWDAASPKTGNQALAISTLEQEGIVVPAGLVHAALAGGSTKLRDGIGGLLADDAAQRAGFKDTVAFLATDAGRAVTSAFNSIPDEDLEFALQRVYDTFRLATESGEETDTNLSAVRSALQLSARNAGLSLRDVAGISDLGGIVVAGGVPRTDLATDPFASLAALQHLSSCGTYSQGSLYGFYQNPLQSALGPSAQDVTAFQNPFLLAEGFRRQLSSLGQAAGENAAVDVQTFANLASAEVRQWAGPGTLLTEDPHDTPETQQNLYLVNIAPQDLGAESVAELQQRLVFVSSASPISAAGDPNSAVAANCMAGLRQNCPCWWSPARALPPLSGDIPAGCSVPAGQDTSVRLATDSSTVTLTPLLDVGLDNPTIKLVYPYPNPVAFTPGSYAVLIPKDGKPGQVLGWLRTPDERSEFYAESFSREQRDLAAKVFGIGRDTEPDRSCANVAPLSLSRDRTNFVATLTPQTGGACAQARRYLRSFSTTTAQHPALRRRVTRTSSRRRCMSP
ncbi:MAG: hypothetical protein ABI627_27365 [Polyangiaceae bacterium]